VRNRTGGAGAALAARAAQGRLPAMAGIYHAPLGLKLFPVSYRCPSVFIRGSLSASLHLRVTSLSPHLCGCGMALHLFLIFTRPQA
jgi:hypothetical protein